MGRFMAPLIDAKSKEGSRAKKYRNNETQI